MAAISGVGGNIALSGAIGGVIKSWTANFTRSNTDTTAFGNVARNRAVGIIDCTGSMTGSMDNTTSPFLAFTGNTVAASLTLTAESGNTLAFSAVIDSFTVGCAVDGEASFSANFQIATTATAITSAIVSTWA